MSPPRSPPPSLASPKGVQHRPGMECHTVTPDHVTEGLQDLSDSPLTPPQILPDFALREGRVVWWVVWSIPTSWPAPQGEWGGIESHGGVVPDRGSPCALQMHCSAHWSQLERLCHGCWCGARAHSGVPAPGVWTRLRDGCTQQHPQSWDTGGGLYGFSLYVREQQECM